MPALAADLVGRRVDLIATEGGILAAQVAKDATSTNTDCFHRAAIRWVKGLVTSLSPAGREPHWHKQLHPGADAQAIGAALANCCLKPL